MQWTPWLNIGQFHSRKATNSCIGVQVYFRNCYLAFFSDVYVQQVLQCMLYTRANHSLKAVRVVVKYILENCLQRYLDQSCQLVSGHFFQMDSMYGAIIDFVLRCFQTSCSQRYRLLKLLLQSFQPWPLLVVQYFIFGGHGPRQARGSVACRGMALGWSVLQVSTWTLATYYLGGNRKRVGNPYSIVCFETHLKMKFKSFEKGFRARTSL